MRAVLYLNQEMGDKPGHQWGYPRPGHRRDTKRITCGASAGIPLDPERHARRRKDQVDLVAVAQLCSGPGRMRAERGGARPTSAPGLDIATTKNLQVLRSTGLRCAWPPSCRRRPRDSVATFANWCTLRVPTGAVSLSSGGWGRRQGCRKRPPLDEPCLANGGVPRSETHVPRKAQSAQYEGQSYHDVCLLPHLTDSRGKGRNRSRVEGSEAQRKTGVSEIRSCLWPQFRVSIRIAHN